MAQFISREQLYAAQPPIDDHQPLHQDMAESSRHGTDQLNNPREQMPKASRVRDLFRAVSQALGLCFSALCGRVLH